MTEQIADGKKSIYCTATPEIFNRTFDVLVRDMCGDDDHVLFCKYYDYRQVVEIFKEHEMLWGDGSIRKAKELYVISEEPERNRVVFSMGQDNVCIEQYDEKNNLAQWDLVIIK